MIRICSILTLLVFTLHTNVASAQTCDDEELRKCVVDSVAACRDASTCDEYKNVLTLQDVRDLAINTCCDKNKRPARNRCLLKERAKYNPKVARGRQRTFFRAARAEVNNVRRTNCVVEPTPTPYQMGADSALF